MQNSVLERRKKLCEQGIYLVDTGHHIEAMPLLEEAAELGSPLAIVVLVFDVYYHPQVPVSVQYVLQKLNQFAEKEIPHILIELGAILIGDRLGGSFVKKFSRSGHIDTDPEKGVQFITQAIEIDESGNEENGKINFLSFGHAKQAFSARSKQLLKDINEAIYVTPTSLNRFEHLLNQYSYIVDKEFEFSNKELESLMSFSQNGDPSIALSIELAKEYIQLMHEKLQARDNFIKSSVDAFIAATELGKFFKGKQGGNVTLGGEHNHFDAFSRYVQAQGLDIYYSKIVLTNIISDLVTTNERLRNTLKTIISDGVSIEIADMAKGDPSAHELKINKIIASIVDRYGIDESSVTEAVHLLADSALSM